MRVAGIGCRKGCPPEPIIALIEEAITLIACPIDALATPDFKHDEPGLQAAASHLNLPLLFITRSALEEVQPLCPTISASALQATGHASIAEAAALAASGGPLLLPRIANSQATCAIAGEPNRHGRACPGHPRGPASPGLHHQSTGR